MSTDPPSRELEGLPAEGELVEGRYRIGKLLGIGGMGVVLAAKHETLGHELALKFMLPSIAMRSGTAQRFLREARASVSIVSEHVARVLDVGSLPSGLPYIVMERLTGEDLATLLEKRGPLSVAEACGYVLQALEAVAEAHSRGIVHRDLKPRNLFLTTRPDGTIRVKVLDFGIAKASELPSVTTLTETSQALGSPHFMSPEQVRDPAKVDARSDIWSLGVALYQLTTDQVPFNGASVPALSAAIVSDPHVPLRTHLPSAPSRFIDAVERCLKKPPTERFQNVAELARAIAPLAPEDDRASAPRVERLLAKRKTEFEETLPATVDPTTVDYVASNPGKTQVDETHPGAVTHTGSLPTRETRRTRPIVIAVIGLALVIAALAFAFRNQQSDIASLPAKSSPVSPALSENTPAPSAAPTEANVAPSPPPEPSRKPFPRAVATAASHAKPNVPESGPAPSPYVDRK